MDFAAPYGVFSGARRFDPELDIFLIADALRPVQGQAGFTVLPNYSFAPPARISRARVVDAGRAITAGGISCGMELGLHLLRRAGWDEAAVREVARVMGYQRAFELYARDLERVGV